MTRLYDYRYNAVRTLHEARQWQMHDQETVLEADLPIVDPHHHLWARETGDFMPAELQREIAGGHNIISTVYVECGSSYRRSGAEELRPVGETEFVINSLANIDDEKQRAALCAGIVGYADLRLGDAVAPVLEAHIEAGQGRFRGIRHSLRWDASGIGMFGKNDPADLCADGKFRQGFRRLASAGLSFDAWLFHPQLPQLYELAKSAPEVPVIINHVGGPLGVGPYTGKTAEVFTQWRDGLQLLAQLPNIYVKLGGLGMLYYGSQFYQVDIPPTSEMLAPAWRPYIETCIELFGAERCMFESNFPVDQQTCSYGTLWNAFKRITQDYSASEKAALYQHTAKTVYRLTI